MPTLKSLNNTPQGGWRYLQPGTNVWFYENNWDLLVSKVRTHREYKGLDGANVEDVSKDVQNQLCMSMTTRECRQLPGEAYDPVPDKTSQLTSDMVLSLSKGLLSFILHGAKWVDKAEAERRSEICRSCPFNKPAAMCSCSAAYLTINKLVPKDRVPAGVDVCMACGCSLIAKVNLPIEVVADSIQKGQKFPSHCWQLEALEK
jgi:hypothetical protein